MMNWFKCKGRTKIRVKSNIELLREKLIDAYMTRLSDGALWDGKCVYQYFTAVLSGPQQFTAVLPPKPPES